jgi:hypothetical protein
VYDHNGQQRFTGGRGIGSSGHGPTSFMANVDGIAGLELVAGPTVYRADGSILWDRLDDLNDGQASVADLDGNGTNEVVLRNAKLTVLNGQTGATIAGPLHPPTEMGMPAECVSPPAQEGQDDPCNIIPTNTAIMDIDGDGELDIAVAAQYLLIAYHRDLSEIYRVTVSDNTGASGPVGFDFEADGYENVVYSDEGHVWSWTSSGNQIYSNEPQFDLAQGLDAWENTGTKWAQARAMWNQHAYAEELISELGTPTWVDGPMPLRGFRRTTARCE